MNRRIAGILSLLVLVLFVLFIIYDVITGRLFTERPQRPLFVADEEVEASWEIAGEIQFTERGLTSVATLPDGVVAGGESFIRLLDRSLNSRWSVTPPAAVKALTTFNDTIYAAGYDVIWLYDLSGNLLEEWGPWESGSIITSLSVNETYVAMADAGVRRVYLLDRSGALRHMSGHRGERYVVPSPYFDVVLFPDNHYLVVNPGRLRIEKRTPGGDIVSMFGEPGTGAQYFSGCCNPSHIAMLNDTTLATSEKGISRIKLYSTGGELLEFVSAVSPTGSTEAQDIAAGGDGKLYVASPEDSRLYVYRRIE